MEAQNKNVITGDIFYPIKKSQAFPAGWVPSEKACKGSYFKRFFVCCFFRNLSSWNLLNRND
ncbi:MAG: hypothetical protein EA361_09915 [Bacteroidetes bacterium]|nr:MAG: hypothetical protein EA361_09915 [Bacteroidota bacterium]